MSNASEANGNPDNTEGEMERKKKTFHGRGQALNHRFKKWWLEARKSEDPPSPYEFLTNFGFDKDSHSMLRMFWTKLACSVPDSNSDYTPGPGVLDYYVHYLRDGLDMHPNGYEDFCHDEEDGFFVEDPIDQALNNEQEEGGVTEQDIKSLIEVIPPSKEQLERCIEQGRSLDLVDSLLGQFPEVRWCLRVTSDPTEESYRQVIDEPLMLTIQNHIGRIKAVSFGPWWTQEAFALCLSMMFQNESPREWDIWIPDKFENNYLIAEDIRSTLLHQDSVSDIEELAIGFSYDNEPCNCLVLDIFCQCMPSLKVLNLTVGCIFKNDNPDQLQLLNDTLSQHLKTTTALEELSISRVSSGKPTKLPFLDVLEALKTNSSLLTFSYKGADTGEMEFYESELVEMLEQRNTTLVQVQLGIAMPRARFRGPEFVEKKRKQIDYYLMLNRKCRGTARDPELQLVDLLELLGMVNNIFVLSAPGYPRVPEWRYTDAINVLFGLLHEQPMMWSSHQVFTQQNSRRVEFVARNNCWATPRSTIMIARRRDPLSLPEPS